MKRAGVALALAGMLLADVIPPQWGLGFAGTLSLSLDCSIGLQCDYSHTGRFSFVGLPTSVTYTSASGVFLTAGNTPTDPNGVPEPASAALVLAALAGLRRVMRRSA